MSYDNNPPLSSQTGARQTMSSWSRVIESFDEVPEAFKAAFKSAMGTSFPYTVFAPVIAGIRHKTAEKLLCEGDDTLYVWERTRQGIEEHALPFDRISDLEFGSILLFSWLTFRGVDRAGVPFSITIEMNTTSVRHFARFVNRIRPAPHPMETAKQQAERAKFDYLAGENFKFMNFGIQSLVEGEEVVQTVWQPEIQVPVMKLGWHTFYRTRALAHLLVLTDQELIVVQDDERSRGNQGIRYGGKWRYIRLDHLETAEVQEEQNELIRLALTVSPGKHPVETVFAASHREEILQLQDALTIHG